MVSPGQACCDSVQVSDEWPFSGLGSWSREVQTACVPCLLAF